MMLRDFTNSYKVLSKLIFSLLLWPTLCYAKCVQQRVAVIDTGLDPIDPRFTSLLCKDSTPWDFVTNKPLDHDFHGHGTHISGLIKEYAKNADYCLLEYRYYDSIALGNNNLFNEISAINRAIEDKAMIINISSGGSDRSIRECETIESAKDVTFILAAGNDGRDIDKKGYYPASCGTPNIIIVGSLDKHGNKLSSSNWGNTVTAWELGLSVWSTLPNDTYGYMSGTSMSTAIHTGKTILQKQRQCDNIQ